MHSYFFAKQPILDVQLSTYGYELLFRSGPEQETAIIDDPDLATINVVSYGFAKSQESIKQHKKIFINFTEQLLLDGAPRALPPSAVVIEVLESVSESKAVLNEIIKYKQEGYLIAIDDYVGKRDSSAYLDVADIIKVDVLNKSEDQVVEILSTIKGRKTLLLAEKVSDGKSYRDLQRLGFDLFQGYFFARPENFSGKRLNSSQLARARALSVLHDPDIEVSQLVELITIDPAITYRLLRLLNSAAFGFSVKIETVEHAVVLLGMRRVKYWLHMVILADIGGEDQPLELFHLALTRGKLLEEMGLEGAISGYQPDTLFLFGILSLLDIMLGRSFAEIFEELPVAPELKNGYSQPDSTLGVLLRLLQSLEANDLLFVAGFCQEHGVHPQLVAEASIRAHSWTERIMEEVFS